MPPNQIPPPTSDALLHKMVARLDNLHADIGDMKSAVRDLASAVTRLALIEERQTQASQSLERAFKEIEKCSTRIDAINASTDTRIDALERAQPMLNQTSQWIITAVHGGAGLAVMFAAKQLGWL
ncbi:hypothetical protein [Giesbergeria anulus]|uniref:Uncharacterized protein n=1 Tax=Giesbergeria anulus TaxID=180197 RepID=A0A1H9E360_9BURK|nr:hypothetical protein [Giesbergeria anulus]SEQ20032.1 hypothetical protein SAMN02982919_00187 [Giesbergeria anulus]